MRILVHIDGGIVQSVSSDSPLDAEVVVIDYDVEGADEEDLDLVPQSDDPTDVEFAYIQRRDKVEITAHHITEYLDAREQ